MKTTTLLGTCLAAAIILIARTGAAQGAPEERLGTLKMRLTTYSQGDTKLVRSKIRESSTATNVTELYRGKIIRDRIRTLDVLELLENSFATNFPTGSRLSSGGNACYVTDRTGTNVILDVSSVLSFETDLDVLNFKLKQTVITDETGENGQIKVSSRALALSRLHYNDLARTTTDGTHTTFRFEGFAKIVTRNERSSFVMTGHGSGMISDEPALLKGILLGKGAAPEMAFPASIQD